MTKMLSRPRFKRHFHVEILESGAVCLLSEYGHFVLDGAIYPLLVPLLDGRHTITDLTAALAGRAAPVQIQRAVSRLEEDGYLTEDDWDQAGMSVHEGAFWDQQTFAHPPQFPPQSRPYQIAVHQFGTLLPIDTKSAFTSVGLAVVEHDAALDVILCTDYLDPSLDAWNRQAVQARGPWLLVKPIGAIVWIGPLFQPVERSACWRCLAARLENHRLIERHVEHANHLPAPLALSHSALPATLQLGLNMAAIEAARWLTLGQSTLTNRVISFDTGTFQTEHHILVKRPQCPVCGTPGPTNTRPVILESRPKGWTLDGGHRSESPWQTYERYRHHVSSITGAVKFLARVSSDEMLNVYTAQINLRDPHDSWNTIYGSTQRRVSGKGVFDIQAKVSGLCEALEQYSGRFQGDEPRRVASFQSLGQDAIHPLQYLGYSEGQYLNRAAFNAIQPPYLQVPSPLDESRAIEWSRVWSLTHQTFRDVLTAYCYYGYPQPEDAHFCLATSNGCAAGSSLEDAILHGFLEAVERDSIAIWWYNRLSKPAFDLDSLGDPYIRALQRHYAALNREFWVLDLTSDLGIPVFAAVTRRLDQSEEDIIVEYGAHFDPHVAILRALTEMNQMLPQEGEQVRYDRWKRSWWQRATIASSPYLAPNPGSQPKQTSDYQYVATEDLREDVLNCVAIAEQHGLEILVLDQTRPDIGLPVVRVIVPGLCFYMARFGFDRLYTVPVRMGWLREPPSENKLNNDFQYL